MTPDAQRDMSRPLCYLVVLMESSMPLALVNCRLVSLLNEESPRDPLVLINQDRIAAIVDRKEFVARADVETVDLRGGYLMPGLIDMHVHMLMNHEQPLVARHGVESSALLGALAARNLRCALDSGITTVRDVGGSLEASIGVKDAWRSGSLTGARPVVAGPMITAIGGHGTERALRIGSEVSGVADVQERVRGLVAQGVDVIKVATHGGASTTELTLDELKAAVAAAHQCGRKVAAHAHFESKSIRNCVLAGCDTIEHGCALDEEIVTSMVAGNVSLCPTITVFQRSLTYPEAYDGRAGAFVGRVTSAMSVHRQGVRAASRAGVRVIAGTDAGMPMVPFDAVHDEIAAMVDWGFTTREALRAATVNAAVALGRSDLGVLRAGAIADLLIIERDPILDIGALHGVTAVYQAGRAVVDR